MAKGKKLKIDFQKNEYAAASLPSDFTTFLLLSIPFLPK